MAALTSARASAPIRRSPIAFTALKGFVLGLLLCEVLGAVNYQVMAWAERLRACRERGNRQVPLFTCLALGVVAFLVAVLVWRTRDRQLRSAEPLSKQAEQESVFERDQRLGGESERNSEAIVQEFQLFLKLGITPSDEWRLRAAKQWKIPTPEELDEEQHHALACGQLPSESWQMRAAMLPWYEYLPKPPEPVSGAARAGAPALSGVMDQIDAELNERRARIIAARAARRG